MHAPLSGVDSSKLLQVFFIARLARLAGPSFSMLLVSCYLCSHIARLLLFLLCTLIEFLLILQKWFSLGTLI